MLAFACSGCGRNLRVEDSAAGKKARCPACGQRTPVPAEPWPVTVAPAAATVPPREAARQTNPDLDATTPPFPPGSSAATAAPPGYEIEGELGRGGMGVVYKARQVKAGRMVALKMILSGAHAGGEELARFRTEAEAVARLQHPNIVQVFEVDEHDGRPFFSLELCEGGSLEKKLNGAPMRPRAAAELVQSLALAVQAAHEADVVHRDLKPANVLLAADGTPKITDFGLAKKLDEASQTRTGAVMGTPSYMAPEQAQAKKDIGPAADIYALGAILYACLTGRPPFRAATQLDTILKVISEEPVPPRLLNAKVPRDLETVCLKCLRKAPAERYASARELAEDLERWEAGEPVRARPVGRLGRVWRWARRRAVVLGLLLSLVLVTGGAAVLTMYAIGEGKRAEQARMAREAAEAEAEAVVYRGDSEAHAKLLEEAVRALVDNRDEKRAAERLGKAADSMRDTWEHRHVLGLLQRLKPRSTFDSHPSKFSCVAMSPDGKRLASNTSDSANRTVRVWDAETGMELLTLKDHTDTVTFVSFSPDGKRLASGTYDGTVKVWDIQTGQQKLTLKGRARGVPSVAFSPDGMRIALWGEDRTAKVWDALTGQEQYTLEWHSGSVLSVAFSPDGKRLASGSRDRTVKVWDAETGKVKFSVTGHTGYVHSVAFSADGKRIVSGGGGGDYKTPPRWGEVKVWDAQTGQLVCTLVGHTGSVLSVAFSPDGKRLASGSRDRTVKVWDAWFGQVKFTIKDASSVAFSPDGTRIASWGEDKTLRVWDAESGRELLSLKGHTDSIFWVAYSPDGKRIASASSGVVRVWDTEGAQEKFTLQGHTGGVTSVAFSPDGKHIASGSGDKTLKVWHAEAGQEPLTLQGHTGWVLGVAFSPDGKRIASGGEDGTVRAWDARTGKDKHTLKGHTGAVLGVAYSPDGTRIASGDDRMVRVWDVGTGQVNLSLKLPLARSAPGVSGVAFSPDGKSIASGGWDRTIKVWDAQTGHEKLTLKGHTDRVYSVAFSPDGKRIASGSLDKTVKVWDAATGQEKLSLTGHTGTVSSVAFSPDGTRIASGSDDRTVRVWDARIGVEKLTLKGHTASVSRVAFSPDGTRIASGSLDQTVKVWEALPPGKK